MSTSQHPNSLANLRAGDKVDFQQDEKGRITNTRSDKGRRFALAICENPLYQKNAELRMIAGTMPPAVEVWLLRLAYGDPPRVKEDDSDEEQRWERARVRLRKLMKEAPEEAAAYAKIISLAGGVRKALPAPVEGEADARGDDE